MTLDELKTRKQELGYTYKMLAQKSGVPLSTIRKIFTGITTTPRRGTILALERILLGPVTDESGYYDQFRKEPRPLMIKEEALAYGGDPKQGHYTVQDYLALPDRPRVELIDGYLYDMAAPSLLHQRVLGELYLQVAKCAERHPECEVLFAPFDVCINDDQWSIVQPDLLILCSRTWRDGLRFYGAPDFVLEVLSPSNLYHDMFRKLNLYRLAGVREYWIVDPEKQKVTVYDFEHDEMPVTYTFHDNVPLTISGGECSVDFRKISEKLANYLRSTERDRDT